MAWCPSRKVCLTRLRGADNGVTTMAETKVEKLRLLFGLGSTEMHPNYEAEQEKLEEYMDATIRALLAKRDLSDIGELSLADTSGISVTVEMRRHELVCIHQLKDQRFATARHPKLSKDIMEAAKARHAALVRLGLTHSDTEDDWPGWKPDKA